MRGEGVMVWEEGMGWVRWGGGHTAQRKGAEREEGEGSPQTTTNQSHLVVGTGFWTILLHIPAGAGAAGEIPCAGQKWVHLRNGAKI